MHASAPQPVSANTSVRWIKISASLTAGALLVVLIIGNAPYIVGPGFWAWTYRRLSAWPLYPLMLLAGVPLLVGQWLYRPNRRTTVVALVLAMVSCFCMKLASVSAFGPSVSEMIAIIVQNKDATSYYTDAAALNSRASVREWLEEYPHLMRDLSLHSKTKPPGPILYYTAFIRTMGVSERTALVAGLVLGAIATLSIPVTYLLLRMLTRDATAAVCGAAYLAASPGFVLFFPMFDPTYIMLSAVLIGLWVMAIDRRSWLAAAGLGFVLAATCTITFNVLVIGAFMACYPLVVAEGALRERIAVSFSRGLVALVVAAVLLLILRQATGYDAIATFQSAWINQHELLERYRDQRLYPHTIPFDLVDFALGSGWMSFALVAMFFVSIGSRDARQVRLTILCIGQLVLVAVTGLLQLETARVWNFMLPLLMLPVGLELSGWKNWERVAVYAILCTATVAIAQNVKFIY